MQLANPVYLENVRRKVFVRVYACFISGNDYTHVYGGSKDDGNYTPCIADCFSPYVKSCILDGEMVGFNADTKTIGSDFIFLRTSMLKLDRIMIYLIFCLT